MYQSFNRTINQSDNSEISSPEHSVHLDGIAQDLSAYSIIKWKKPQCVKNFKNFDELLSIFFIFDFFSIICFFFTVLVVDFEILILVVQTFSSTASKLR